jgi:hypothetical protein
MTHPKKKHRQFALGVKDASVVGRLGGGYPLYGALDWYQNLYGVGLTGVGYYHGSNMDSTSSQGTNSNDTDSGADATGDAAGGTAAGMGSV